MEARSTPPRPAMHGNLQRSDRTRACGGRTRVRTCVRLIVCVLIPRFELAVAAGGREALAAGPVALAPEPGREQLIGEVSAAAEALRASAPACGWGRRSRAARRCGSSRPTRPGWPTSGTACWRALEGIGAAVEPGRPGARLVRRPRACATSTAATVEGVIAAARRALGTPARIGAAPSRFAALAAASPRPRPARRARARRPGLARPPTWRRCRSSLLAVRGPQTAALPEPLERFGIRTLGELAKLPRAALADRFGAAGPLARDLARGPRHAAAPAPRRRAAGGAARAARVGVRAPARARARPADRPAARPPRAPRPDAARRRARRPSSSRAGPGATRVTFREALADPRRMRLVLRPEARRAARRPPTPCACAPRASARRRATSARCWPSPPPSAPRGCARRSARRAPPRGPDAALRILAVDPDSRVPERRLALTPWDP